MEKFLDSPLGDYITLSTVDNRTEKDRELIINVVTHEAQPIIQEALELGETFRVVPN